MSIRVLVVDESLFMRTLISDLLSADPEIEVIDRARSGAEALRKLAHNKPDVVTLDLNMPGMDGLTTLRHIMKKAPLPVVIVSAYSRAGAQVTMECLNSGAVGAVPKPSGELSLDIAKIKVQLTEEVKAAAKADVRKVKELLLLRPRKPKQRDLSEQKILVLGASTGGPPTLEAILRLLPGGFPAPILVVQHMPNPFFSESFAQRLNSSCECVVQTAQDGQIIEPGKVILAPGGSHMQVQRHSSGATVALSQARQDPLSPSIDRTMESAAAVFGQAAVGIILTGMGRDGVIGMRAIQEAGGKTIAQDESAVLYGMPKAVIEEGFADQVLPASEIAEAMMEAAAVYAG